MRSVRTATVILGAFVATVGACGAQVSIGGQPSDAGSDGSSAPLESGPPTSGTFTADDGNPCVAVERDSLAIRQRSCATCHGPGSSAQGAFGYVMDDAQLIAGRSQNYTDDAGQRLRMVVPGDPLDSWLYIRTANGSHPPNSGVETAILGPKVASMLVRPTASDISILYEWILSCLGVDGRALHSSDATYGPPPGDATTSPDGAPATGNSTDDSEPVAPEGSTADVATQEVGPPPAGVAGVAFVVNGLVQNPLACPADNWEYRPVDKNGQPLCGPYDCSPQLDSGIEGVTSAVLINTGQVPVAYIAQSLWNGDTYVPGVNFGEPNELSGVLAPGAEVDITSVFVGGIVALVGSSLPLSNPDAGRYVADEGMIPWPAGVGGSQGSPTMWVAQIDIQQTCSMHSRIW